MEKLWKQKYYIHLKINKMDNGNEKNPRKIKVKFLYELLRNKFVQKFPQTIK